MALWFQMSIIVILLAIWTGTTVKGVAEACSVIFAAAVLFAVVYWALGFAFGLGAVVLAAVGMRLAAKRSSGYTRQPGIAR
jgi:hypothetical protein